MRGQFRVLDGHLHIFGSPIWIKEVKKASDGISHPQRTYGYDNTHANVVACPAYDAPARSVREKIMSMKDCGNLPETRWRTISKKLEPSRTTPDQDADRGNDDRYWHVDKDRPSGTSIVRPRRTYKCWDDGECSHPGRVIVWEETSKYLVWMVRE